MRYRIMGVDPGLQATGYGLIDITGESPGLIEGGVIRTVSSTELPKRLSTIYKGISEVVSVHMPDIIVVEDLFTSYSHPQTAVLMGHARGAILLAAAECSIPVEVYTATMVKRALTGNGRASKVQVASMVSSLLRLLNTPKTDHVTDALALALCHNNMVRNKGLACSRFPI